MFKVKKFCIILFSGMLSLFLFADESEVYTNQPLYEQSKLQSSLQQTELESKLRLKIDNQLQEQQSTPQTQISSPKTEDVLHEILMYIPNRLIDLTDIITMGAGVGPQASLELTFTEWGQFAGIYGDRYFIEKGYNRQYGGGYQSSYNAAFLCWSRQQDIVEYTFGSVQTYANLSLKNSSVSCPCSEPFKSGKIDFWRIGIKVGWIVDFEMAIHPVAIANFFTGFAFYRLTDTQDL